MATVETAMPVRPSGVRRRLRLRLGLWLLERTRPGQSLPSVRRLAETAGVHRNTAAAVYADLARFGLVRCVPGSGTYAGRVPDHRRPLAIPAESCPAMRAALAAELGDSVGIDDGSSATPLLVALDEVPPCGRPVVPLVPRGPASAALRRLRPGDEVILLSASPRLGRLVRHVLDALGGPDIGLQRITGSGSPGVARAGLVLSDACQSVSPGTTRAPKGLIKLRLLADTGPDAG